MTPLSRRALLRYAGAGAAATVLGRAGAAAATPAAAPPTAAAAATPTARVPLTLARVRPVTAAQRALVARLDDTHAPSADGTVEVLLRDGDLARFTEAGLDYELVQRPAVAAARPEGLLPQPGETADGEYRLGSARYEADLKALVAAHAATGRVRLLEMPTKSILGTTVYAVEIATDVAASDGRPVVMHDGMHHCREWPSGEMPMMWAHELLESYDTDPVIRRIVDGTRTIVLPLVNPDGFDRTVEAAALLGQSSDDELGGLVLAVAGLGDMHRKNLRAPSNLGPLEATGPVVGGSPVGASQPDAYGIDLNRNYPFHWGDESGSSSQPYDQTYRGLAPFSEPETHNVRDLVRANLPITHITHHTSGRQMLIPWGRDPQLVRSPDWPLMKAIGDDMRDGFTGPDGQAYAGNGYDPTQAFNLYPTSGTSRDWGHACTRTIIYTFEHGTEFHGPYAATVPAMYALNRGAFVRHSLAALDEAVQARITGRGPKDGSIEVRKTFLTPTNLQVVGVPVLSVGGLPPVQDPTGDALRPTLVEETVSRTVQLDSNGKFDLRVPPSTRPFLVNEQQLEGFEPGDTEPYEVVARDAAGAVVWTAQVTVDRGFTAEVDEDHLVVVAVGVQDTDPTPGD